MGRLVWIAKGLPPEALETIVPVPGQPEVAALQHSRGGGRK
jgi:hypothetical protein